MVEEASAGHDIRMQREMWSTFCKLTKWVIAGLVIMLLLMWAFLV